MSDNGNDLQNELFYICQLLQKPATMLDALSQLFSQSAGDDEENFNCPGKQGMSNLLAMVSNDLTYCCGEICNKLKSGRYLLVAGKEMTWKD